MWHRTSVHIKEVSHPARRQSPKADTEHETPNNSSNSGSFPSKLAPLTGENEGELWVSARDSDADYLAEDLTGSLSVTRTEPYDEPTPCKEITEREVLCGSKKTRKSQNSSVLSTKNSKQSETDRLAAPLKLSSSADFSMHSNHCSVDQNSSPDEELHPVVPVRRSRRSRKPWYQDLSSDKELHRVVHNTNAREARRRDRERRRTEIERRESICQDRSSDEDVYRVIRSVRKEMKRK